MDHLLCVNKHIHMKVVFTYIVMSGPMNREAVERLIQFIFGTLTIKEFHK